MNWERFKELNVWAEYVRSIHVQLVTPGSRSVDPRVHESDGSPRSVMLLLGREQTDKRPSCPKYAEEESVWRPFTKFDLPGKVIGAEWDSSSPLDENIWRYQRSKYFTRQTYEILSATGIFLMPSDMINNTSNQVYFLVMVAVFRVQYSLSIIPVVWGWYAVVRSLWKPIITDRSLNSSLSKWLPRSEITCNGTPKHETHVFKHANAMVIAEVSCKGVSSTRLVAL